MVVHRPRGRGVEITAEPSDSSSCWCEAPPCLEASRMVREWVAKSPAANGSLAEDPVQCSLDMRYGVDGNHSSSRQSMLDVHGSHLLGLARPMRSNTRWSGSRGETTNGATEREGRAEIEAQSLAGSRTLEDVYDLITVRWTSSKLLQIRSEQMLVWVWCLRVRPKVTLSCVHSCASSVGLLVFESVVNLWDHRCFAMIVPRSHVILSSQTEESTVEPPLQWKFSKYSVVAHVPVSRTLT